MFSYSLLHSSDSVTLVLFSSLLFSFLILVVQNVAKSQSEKNIQKPGENLENQLLVPGDFLTRRQV
jgi:hypothetical protein